MDKRKTLKLIAAELLGLKKYLIGDTEYITADQLDILIFETCGKMDRNLKYEMRNYLKMFEILSIIAVPGYDFCFVINPKKIKEFCGGEKKG